VARSDILWSKRVQIDRRYASSCVGVIAVILILYCGPAHAETRVLLLRGWFGVFSSGLDAIAESLKTKGIHAEVAGHLQWKAAVDEILRERAQGKTDSIVLVGHSQGANNIIDMARLLDVQNVPVALLVTLAPYRQNPVPANVMRAVNYYQSGGWGAPLTAGPGFRGKLSNVDVAEDTEVSHINIDKSPRVQAEIAREIAAVAKTK
jgi:hypothetical protein